MKKKNWKGYKVLLKDYININVFSSLRKPAPWSACFRKRAYINIQWADDTEYPYLFKVWYVWQSLYPGLHCEVIHHENSAVWQTPIYVYH